MCSSWAELPRRTRLSTYPYSFFLPRPGGHPRREDDLRDAMEKLAAYVGTLPTERKIAVMGGEGGPDTDHRGPKAKTAQVDPTALQQLTAEELAEASGNRRREDGARESDSSTKEQESSGDRAEASPPETTQSDPVQAQDGHNSGEDKGGC